MNHGNQPLTTLTISILHCAFIRYSFTSMKHLLLVTLIATSLTVKAQTPVAILDTTESGIIFKTVPPYQGNGKTDTIKALVDPALISELKFTKVKLYTLSLTTNRKAAGTLKEQSSYKVGENFRIYRVNNEIKYSWEYYGQNSYGAEKKSTIVVTFDEKGNFKSQTVL